MIRRVRATNWKAYKALDLQLTPGTTFVVARNGVGKTSLIQAMAWGLFGERNSNVNPRQAVRVDTGEASVSVELDLPSGETVTIARSIVRETGETDVALTIGAETLSGQTEVDRVIREAFNADPLFLARVCLLAEGSIARDTKTSLATNIYDHFSQVLGVADLRATAKEFLSLGKRAQRETAGYRTQQRAQSSERERWEQTLAAIESDLTLIDESVQSLESLEKAAQNGFDTARLWEAHDVATEKHDSQIEELAERVRAIAPGVLDDGGDLRDSLAAMSEGAQARQASARDRQALATARIESIARFIEELSDVAATCPMCLRPIDAAETDHALDRHRRDTEELERELAAAEHERLVADEQLRQARSLAEEALALQPPKAPSGPRPSDVSTAKDQLETHRVALDEAREKRAGLRERRTTMMTRLESDQRIAREAALAERAYRTESLAAVATATLEQVADAITTQRIEPMAIELRRRWKGFWSRSGGLRILPPGELALVDGEREIFYEEMSGGERVIAILLLRLIAVYMTTSAKFLWLDEPLEHLDPRNRRMVASMLVNASANAQFDQLLVTTYEEPVARRLADRTPNAKLVYVTSDPVDLRS